MDTDANTVEMGVDLSEFYMSVEWDILEVPAVRYCTVYIPLSRNLANSMFAVLL